MSDLDANTIRSARLAAGWSVAEAAGELKRRSPQALPDTTSLVRSWKRWEAGTQPGRMYRQLLIDLFAAPDDPAGGTLVQTSSLTVWRRWLAFELRRLREEAQLSPKEATRRLRWSGVKLRAIENAQQSVTTDDLDKLLPFYGVPADRWATYQEAAGNSRGRGWWQRYDQREIGHWFSLYVGLEQGASQLQVYEPVAVPGLLQTKEYAAAVLSSDVIPRTPRQVNRLVDLRIARQAALTRQPNALALSVVLDEAVLHRLTGDATIMAKQLIHVVEMAKRPNVDVRVLPLAVGVHSAAFGKFSVLGFPWASDPGVVYIENRSGAVYLEAEHEVDAHALVFQHLSVLSLPEQDSIALISDLAKEGRTWRSTPTTSAGASRATAEPRGTASKSPS